MNKLKIPMVIVITLVLLCFFACFPKLVSWGVDLRSGKTPFYSDILPVELDIIQDVQSLSFPEKLFLLKDAQVFNLNQSQATMTEAEVEAAIAAFMGKCEAAGIYEAFQPTQVTMQPKLVYDISDPTKHIVIWSVTIINKNEPNQSLGFDVDDETGAILCMTYSIYRSYAMDDVWNRNKAVMERFADLYFDQLGIIAQADAAEINHIGYEYKELDGGVSEAIYTFEFNGKFAVQFTVDGAGGFMITLL